MNVMIIGINFKAKKKKEKKIENEKIFFLMSKFIENSLSNYYKRNAEVHSLFIERLFHDENSFLLFLLFSCFDK